jgi:hypothetical protein
VPTILLAAAMLAAGSQSSDAAFTAQTSNPANQLSAASSFERLRVASGTYTGNATDSRNITGLGFQPNLVIVKANSAQTAVARSSTMSGDVAKPLSGATALTANLIQNLQADGFQVGTDARVNASATTYYWVAIKAATGTMSLGTYTGNGATVAVSGLGYSPEAVMVLGAGAQSSVLRIAGMTTGFTFDSGTGVSSSVTSLDSGGFTVGNNAATSSSGVVYHYIAFNDVPGITDVATYTGNGAARTISGLGLNPSVALVRSTSTTSARAGVWRPSSVTGTGSLRFNAAVNDTTAITALGSGSFNTGTSVDANASANAYAYLALKDEGP